LNQEQLKILEMIDCAPVLRDGNRWYDNFVAALRLKDRAERIKALNKIDDDLKGVGKKAVKEPELDKLVQGNDPPDMKAVKAMGDVFAKAIGDSVLLKMMPDRVYVYIPHDRVEQEQRNLDVAFALAAYRNDNGRYPAKLDDLAPKYLAAVPNDLCSGKALIYRPSETGYSFYSVGFNGKDDEGHSYDDEPRGTTSVFACRCRN
jgi:hypothetical protein